MDIMNKCHVLGRSSLVNIKHYELWFDFNFQLYLRIYFLIIIYSFAPIRIVNFYVWNLGYSSELQWVQNPNCGGCRGQRWKLLLVMAWNIFTPKNSRKYAKKKKGTMEMLESNVIVGVFPH